MFVWNKHLKFNEKEFLLSTLTFLTENSTNVVFAELSSFFDHHRVHFSLLAGTDFHEIRLFDLDADGMANNCNVWIIGIPFSLANMILFFSKHTWAFGQHHNLF